MVKKIILIFSLLFSSISLLLMSDIYSSLMIYSSLDSLATTVSYYIAKEKGINETIKSFVKKEMDANIYCANEDCEHIKVGDPYFYVISKEYKGLILNSNDNLIKVKRCIIIGEYY